MLGAKLLSSYRARREVRNREIAGAILAGLAGLFAMLLAYLCFVPRSHVPASRKLSARADHSQRSPVPPASAKTLRGNSATIDWDSYLPETDELSDEKPLTKQSADSVR